MAGHSVRSLEYRDLGQWNRVMTPVSSQAVILTASAAFQHTGFFNGHQNICEPTTVPALPNFTGVEVGGTIPNTGLQIRDHISHSTTFVPNLILDYPSDYQQDIQSWPSSTFDFSPSFVSMSHHPTYPLYNQDCSHQDQEYPPPAYSQHYPAFGPVPLLEGSLQQFIPPPSGICQYPDYTLFPDVAPGYAVPNFSPQPDSQDPDVTDNDWYEINNGSSSEWSGGSSPVNLMSADPRPRHASDDNDPYDYFQLIPDPTNIRFEVDSHTLAVQPRVQTSRNSQHRVEKNKGGRKAKLTTAQRTQASITRQKVACLRCQYQKKTVSTFVARLLAILIL